MHLCNDSLKFLTWILTEIHGMREKKKSLESLEKKKSYVIYISFSDELVLKLKWNNAEFI